LFKTAVGVQAVEHGFGNRLTARGSHCAPRNRHEYGLSQNGREIVIQAKAIQREVLPVRAHFLN
jgi:hypothetical protein